jgi:hypothetical protein
VGGEVYEPCYHFTNRDVIRESAVQLGFEVMRGGAMHRRLRRTWEAVSYLLAQGAVRDIVLGDHQQAAGALVEAVHDPGSDHGVIAPLHGAARARPVLLLVVVVVPVLPLRAVATCKTIQCGFQ